MKRWSTCFQKKGIAAIGKWGGKAQSFWLMQSSAGSVGQGALSILLSAGKGLFVFRRPEGQSSLNRFSPCVRASAAFSFCVMSTGELICCASVHSAGTRVRWRIRLLSSIRCMAGWGFFFLTRIFSMHSLRWRVPEVHGCLQTVPWHWTEELC